MKAIRIGILGTANIAKRSIIPELKKQDDKFTIVGIASRNKVKAIKTAKAFDVKPYFSYEDLINEEGIDAIYIPLPNALHFQYAKMALSKGLHVLVEKSLGVSFKEVNELVKLAEERSLLLVENFQFRFHSQLQYLLNLIQTGVIGDIRSLNANFCFPPFRDKNNIRYDKTLGGGALLDAGAYTVKISSIILGNGLHVEGATLNTPVGFDVDIWGGAFLKQAETGKYASLTFGFDHYYQCGVQIIGTKGKVSANRLFTAPSDLNPIFELGINGKEKEIVKLPSDNHFANMLSYFFHSVSNQEAKALENAQNLVQAQLIHEINLKNNA
ncbi:Gfo/Idh/MocA family oxidoreductase [Mangrovimonas sp. CR14]|uniref:Gfo/Idh/MocA family protein n=1 Tax=Mangrovimonas sp. CR14 TaxID=2706120 RepID=UPI0014238D83|nr:Gfo/Idh/MocA family oxidoreductase [Mangrovimonas sp. CR14]NIK91377.1 Gfo/Idh/MocA family oxidoreductase [Mangrovimonas sp. CR14]